MAVQDVRNILLRALFDAEFNAALAANPEKALQGYNLTPEESQLLKKPGPELYGFLRPEAESRTPSLDMLRRLQPQPACVVVAVIVVVAITVFAVAVTMSNLTAAQQNQMERIAPLATAIRNSSGATRADLIRTLIIELTQE